ncbi:MAG TPA: N-acetyltransferase [bacterium]|nr:N-acetyltransferase [bacterium]
MIRQIGPITMREAKPEDLEAILALHRRAFGGEAEASLIRALEEGGYSRLSWIAEEAGEVAGHIFFSEIDLQRDAELLPVLALAPMAVHPAKQRRGIGQALLGEGLEQCRRKGFPAVFVLGNPGFYGKLGFSPKLAEPFSSPYSGPHFMAIELRPNFLKKKKGRVLYSRPFLALES